MVCLNEYLILSPNVLFLKKNDGLYILVGEIVKI